MNSAIWNARRIANFFRDLKLEPPKTLVTHNLFPFNPKSIHTQPKKPQGLELATPISNLLSNGGTWDSLSTSFSYAELTDALIETVLLQLKEPMNANKALLFFHWSSHHRRFQHGLRSYCITVHILVRAGLLVDARALLESATKKNSEAGHFVEHLVSTFEATHSSPHVFDLLIQTYSKMRMVEQAFDACRYVADQGFLSSLISCNTMLHVAQKSNRNDLAWKIYEYMIQKRVYPNQAGVEIMTNVMCKEGTLRKTVNTLDRILCKRCAPGIIVNTALALRIFDENRVGDGTLLLKRMLQKNIILDGVVYSLIVFAHCKMGELELAYELYDDMLSRGCSRNAFVHTAFIRAHCKKGRTEEAARLLHEMESIGLKPYDETYSSLIEGNSMMGRVEESLVFYEDMLRKDFLLDCFACNKMMGMLCDIGEAEKANEILTALLEKGFVADEAIYLKLIDGFGRLGKDQEILKLYYEMKHRGLGANLDIDTSLAESLHRYGKLKGTEKPLTGMGIKVLAPTM